jgi:hypothetical protein
MSAPIDDGEEDDRLKYAPRWARERAPAQDDLDGVDPLLRFTTAPTNVPAVVEQGRPPRREAGEFEGDIAIRQLRRRMSLEPNVVPEPPQRVRSKSLWQLFARFAAVIVLAAAAAYLVVIYAFPNAKKLDDYEKTASLAPVALPGGPRAERSKLTEPAPPPQPAALPRLIVESRRATVDERMPLGVALKGALNNGAVFVTGLATGTQLSVGEALGANGWRVPVRDIASATVQPPRNYSGTMDVSIELRLPDDTVADSQMARLEWVPPPPQTSPAAVAAPVVQPQVPMAAPSPVPSPVSSPSPRLNPEEIATLLKNGQDYIASGDISAARIVLRRAAEAGEARAALALGSTYDPVALKRLNVLGYSPDTTQARVWYQRAVDLGSTEAAQRLEQLVQAAR